MGRDDDELRRQRHVRDDVRGGVSRIRSQEPPDPGNAVACWQILDNGRKPTSLPGVFAVAPATASGADREGTAVRVDAGTGTAFLMVVGSSVPETGDVLPARLLEWGWTAEHHGGGTCRTCVIPTGLCGPVIGAHVTVYGDERTVDGKAVYAAYTDDLTRNNHTYGEGTVGVGGEPYCLTVRPGVYAVKITAGGYDDVTTFVYACSACTTLYTKLAFGQTVTLVTSDVTATLTAAHDANILIYPLIPNPITDGGAGPVVSQALYFDPTPPATRSFVDPYNYPFICHSEPTTGTTLDIEFGCSAVTGQLELYLFAIAHGDVFLARNSVECVGGSDYLLRLRGVVTGIQVDPFKVTGVWDDYWDFGWLIPPENGPEFVNPPGPGLPNPPVSGAFTIT